MHLKRIITGLVALPFLIYLIAKGGLSFFVLVLVAGLLALWEYLKIVCADPPRTVLSFLSVLAMVTAALILWAAFQARFDLIVLLLAADVILAGITAIVKYADDKTIIEVKGSTTGECLNDLAQQHPELAKILLNKDGSLLHTYDVFINGESAYPNEMNKPVKDGDKLYIVPIIHGG